MAGGHNKCKKLNIPNFEIFRLETGQGLDREMTGKCGQFGMVLLNMCVQVVLRDEGAGVSWIG